MMAQTRDVPIRCPYCDARLFDASGGWARPDEPGADIQIKCGRCKRVVAVRVLSSGSPCLSEFSGKMIKKESLT